MIMVKMITRNLDLQASSSQKSSSYEINDNKSPNTLKDTCFPFCSFSSICVQNLNGSIFAKKYQMAELSTLSTVKHSTYTETARKAAVIYCIFSVGAIYVR